VSVGGSPDSGWLHETRPEQAHPTTQPGVPGVPGTPVTPGAPEPPDTPGSGKMWAAALVAMMLVFVGLGGYDLFANRHVLGLKPVARPAASASRSMIAYATRTPSASATGNTSASATAPGSPSASSSPPTMTPLQVLSAVSVLAFGPDGTSDGDNPGIASRVLADDGVDAWQSAWYKSAAFGNLQAGTGLLIDMGRQVSISSVHLVLGASLGADVQVRVGDTSELDDLSTAASADDAGGKVRLALPEPVRARYVLVWFTLLPPDGAGTYQVSVYSAIVDGRS